MRLKQSTVRFAIVVTIAWLICVVTGLGLLLRYKSTPGHAAEQPAQWPDAARLARHAETWTLVMFAHPKCPCTRASLNELSRLLTRCQGRVQSQIVFIKPVGTSDEWMTTDIVEQAQAISHVTVAWDRGGELAATFRVSTSGHVVLYDATGRLRFSGGITVARGHEGANAGAEAIARCVLENAPAPRQTGAFGCPLAQTNSDRS